VLVVCRRAAVVGHPLQRPGELRLAANVDDRVAEIAADLLAAQDDLAVSPVEIAASGRSLRGGTGTRRLG
jgi:hypothetical protein